jgi:pyruvoyl-dependent arginine decarboxylase (PvlArgDC)
MAALLLTIITLTSINPGSELVKYFEEIRHFYHGEILFRCFAMAANDKI